MNRIIPAVLTATAVFTVTTARMAHSAEVPADIAEMKVQDLRAGGDAKKRYFVIHRSVEPPPSGWRTLFVLPGGSGHANFQPFVTRIAKNALLISMLICGCVPRALIGRVPPIRSESGRHCRKMGPQFSQTSNERHEPAHKCRGPAHESWFPVHECGGDLVTLAPLLAGRGYSAADIDGILQGNFLRFLRGHLR